MNTVSLENWSNFNFLFRKTLKFKLNGEITKTTISRKAKTKTLKDLIKFLILKFWKI